MPKLTAADLISRIGERLGNRDGDRYPDLEQDAMRYWVNREFIANLAGITVEQLDEATDTHIDKLLKPFDHEL